MNSKAYSARTIDGLKAVKEKNDTRRERAVSALVRLSASGRQRQTRR